VLNSAIAKHERSVAIARAARDSTIGPSLTIQQPRDVMMSSNKNTQFNRGRKPTKRVPIGETREEEAARLEKEIAAHPVTICKPGQSNPSSRPGWSSQPFIPLSERIAAEAIAKKMMRKPKTKS
jgi:hypothetical protein